MKRRSASSGSFRRRALHQNVDALLGNRKVILTDSSETNAVFKTAQGLLKIQLSAFEQFNGRLKLLKRALKGGFFVRGLILVGHGFVYVSPLADQDHTIAFAGGAVASCPIVRHSNELERG